EVPRERPLGTGSTDADVMETFFAKNLQVLAGGNSGIHHDRWSLIKKTPLFNLFEGRVLNLEVLTTPSPSPSRQGRGDLYPLLAAPAPRGTNTKRASPDCGRLLTAGVS
ncbi:MAG: hypothetical protein WAW37_08675, partial [Syntrophobacteraceae bacterium]